jgi:phospholipid/cholesterol/gamma-HCH transport system substrate-binding protein
MKVKLWRNEVKVGLMIILGLALLSALLLKAARWQPNLNNQHIKIKFNNVGGLLKNASVSMYGMAIGRVIAIELMGDWVQVTAQIDKKAEIREGYRIVIDIIGIVGEKYIAIINGPIGNKLVKEEPLIGTNPPTIGEIMVQVNDIAQKSSSAINILKELVATNEEGVRSSIKETRAFISETKDIIRRTINNLDILLARVNRITEGKESDIAKTVTELKTLATELNKDRERISPIVKSMAVEIDQMIKKSSPVVDGSLENLRKSSEEIKTLTGKIDKYVEDLNKSVSQVVAQVGGVTDSSDKKLQKALIDFGRATALLNNVLDRADYLVEDVEKGNGTLGKLIKSDEGYKQINETIAVSKNAIGKIGDLADNINKRLDSFKQIDTINAMAEYRLNYSSVSESLQNRLRFTVLPKSNYFYTAGIFLKGEDVGYDLLANRKFGENFNFRGGFIKSKAGLGLDYRLIPDRAELSVDGVGITQKNPEINVDASVKVFRNWYLMFGAEDVISSKPGFNIGVKTVVK